MEFLHYTGLDLKLLNNKFHQTLEYLKNGDFSAAEVKKMPETNLYRAKLDYSSRLIFRFAKYKNQTYLLLLEIITNHDYSKSKFLRGTNVDENKLLPLQNISGFDSKEIPALPYLNPKEKRFHLLNKIISFDDEQQEALHLPPPLILIGSAGSGKTALALEKIKSLSGNILYVTLSPYLAEHAAHIYYSNNYENEEQEIDFLSFREFLESIRIPEGKKMDFRVFEQWFLPHRHHSGIKDTHKLFEEFNGVITGFSIEKEFLRREDYINLGIKQSIFLPEERSRVYDLFEKYSHFLKEQKYYDIHMVANRWTKFCRPIYDFVVVDEVQDYTNIQLFLILKSLKQPGNFILCGDSNQIVHPNFFSWSKVKTMFYHHLRENNVTRILTTNYRNSPQVTGIANRLLKIKNARFGSIDRESTYLIQSASARNGEALLLQETDEVKAEFNQKTRQSTQFAVLVMRNEDKAEAAKFFNTPLLFSIQEAKGLEYENILLYNFVSENTKIFREISSNITSQEINQDEINYSRAGDKADKSLEAYKFYINSLFVGITRAIGNLYIIEKDHKQELLSLLEINVTDRQLNLQQQISTKDEWQREAQRLEKQGRTEQAELIRKTILGTQPVPWKVITLNELNSMKKEALDSKIFNKKAKDKIFDYALIYNDTDIMRELVRLNYKRAERYESERGSLMRRFYVDYAQDNVKQIMAKVSKYGADYRDEFNLTPLMAAAYAGAVNIIQYLLAVGAKTETADNFGKNALQTALFQSYFSKDFIKNKLRKVYPLIVTESIKVKADNRLVKIDNHKFEYILLNLLIAVQKDLIKQRGMTESCGLTMDDFVAALQEYPDIILPPYRKKRTYINAVLARNEITREDMYNKKLFLRLERGYYVLNPQLEIQPSSVEEYWLNVYDMLQTEKIDKEKNKEIMKVRLSHHLDNLAEKEAHLKEKISDAAYHGGMDPDKLSGLRKELFNLNKESNKIINKITILENNPD